MGKSERLRLVRPAVEFRESYLAGWRELAADSEKESWVYLGDDPRMRDFPERDFAGYVDTLLERECKPASHFVRGTTYWGLVDGEIVGRISLRHELNDFLRNFGGHIGYIVRPTYRRRGIASELLAQILRTDRAREIGRLLLACDEGNVASERTILRNGGIFEGVVELSDGRPRRKRFWITVA